jgi:hypothetical protein
MDRKMVAPESGKDIEALLGEYYEVGTSQEAADAYPALMLLLPARRGYRPEGRGYCVRNAYGS